MIEAPENVNAFASECGKFLGDSWFFHHENRIDKIIEESESPIEALFGIAFYMLEEVNEHRLMVFVGENGADIEEIHIEQQKKIGKYRADFFLSFLKAEAMSESFAEKIGRKKLFSFESRHVVVELDGQDFHDKNEKQRRYEKERDRYMQKKGLKVFRYTGTEIVKNPFTAAAECLLFLLGDDDHDRLFFPRIKAYGEPEWQNIEL